MQTYSVYEPPKAPPQRIRRAERLVFVRDGFSWMAALFGPLWMLVHRMWLALFLYIVLMAALVAAMMAAEMNEQWITVATVAVHLAIGFEAGSLRRWKLERGRWRMLGAVVGQSRMDCERRFFQGWLADTRDDAVRWSATSRQAASTKAPGPIAGSVGSQM